MPWLHHLVACWFLIAAGRALTLPTTKPGRASRHSLSLNQQTRLANTSTSESPKKKTRCSRCPEPNDDNPDMDRREAAFAMLGAIWATTSAPAYATYGQDAKIELPNPVQDMARRTNEQCLVESLGNRQCLVYLDPANKLYQKPDNQVLLQRIDKASASLATIPALAQAKKWSQVNGVLTGPLGQLVLTMQGLAKQSENTIEAMAIAKKVKGDIIDIGQASDKKQGNKVLEYHQKATDDLVAFIKSL